MALNLDADVGQIIKDFLSKKSKDSSSSVKNNKASNALVQHLVMKLIIILSVTAILGWLIHYVSNEPVARQESEFTSLLDLDMAVVKIEQDIASSRVLLGNNRKKVAQLLPMFSNMEGSKSLFKLVSTLTEQNNLVIKNLSQGETIETTSPSRFLQTKIVLEAEGSYPSYIRFKQELHQQKPILSIEEEVVKLKYDVNGERKIDIKISFYDYSVDKREYEKVLEAKSN
jgi:hypothetical protein